MPQSFLTSLNKAEKGPSTDFLLIGVDYAFDNLRIYSPLLLEQTKSEFSSSNSITADLTFFSNESGGNSLFLCLPSFSTILGRSVTGVIVSFLS